MWALKNSFLVSMSTMYLKFDRRKTRLETVLHTLLICESQRSLLSMLYPKDGVLTLDQFSPRLERDRVVRVITCVSVSHKQETKELAQASLKGARTSTRRKTSYKQ